MGRPKSDYSIQTVSNAFHMLEAFFVEDEFGVSELSRRLGLHKNNVFRLLATLEQSGYIEQDPVSERYLLGTRCLELGQAYQRSHSLLSRARAVLEQLARKSGETVHLASLRDFTVVHLDGVGSEQAVLSAPRIGQRLPVHCTALGKVLVGCGDREQRENYGRRLLAAGAPQSRTEATLVDAQKLMDELVSVGSLGFAIDLEECEAGMRCVAAPVRDSSGAVVAAISISGPAFRLPEEALRGDAARRVLAAAEELSQQLGYSAG